MPADSSARDLQFAEALVHDILYCSRKGIAASLGPSLGLNHPLAVIGNDGKFLGNASLQVSQDKRQRVIDIEAGLQGVVGAPELADVKVGLVKENGWVVAAERKVDWVDAMRLEGTEKVIGKVALKEPSTAHPMRVLIMGGDEEFRCQFLRETMQVSVLNFMLELEADEDRLQSKEELLDKSTRRSLERRQERRKAGFKFVSTFADQQRNSAFLEMSHRIKELSETIQNKSKRLEWNMDEEERANKYAKLEAEHEGLTREFEAYKRSQGSASPFAQNSQSLRENKSRLYGLEAANLFFRGANDRSLLENFSSPAGFWQTFCDEACQHVEKEDAKLLFSGEIFLSTSSAEGSTNLTPPENFIYVLAPDIVQIELEQTKNNEKLAALRKILLPKVGELIASLKSSDLDNSGTVDRNTFLAKLESLNLLQVMDKQDALHVFALLGPDSSGYVEYNDLKDLLGAAKVQNKVQIDQFAAFRCISSCCDKIVVLLDGKSSRYNWTELEIIKDLYQTDASKMHFACVSHQHHLDALARTMALLLGDRALENIPRVSSLREVFSSELSQEEQQMVSLCKDLSDVLRNVLMRTNNLLQQASDVADMSKWQPCTLDSSAIARANQELSDILKFYTRKLSSNNRLLQRLKRVIKLAKQNSDSMLDNSGILERMRKWNKQKQLLDKTKQEATNSMIFMSSTVPRFRAKKLQNG
eukprot:753972-Hanusia_phi.AAC.4